MTAPVPPKDSAEWRHFLVTSAEVPRYWAPDELYAAVQRGEPGAVALLQHYEVVTALYLLTR